MHTSITHVAKQTAQLTVGLLLGLAGCKTPQSLPEDPLFISRAPMEVKAKSGPPIVLVRSEPSMPPSPLDREQPAPRTMPANKQE